MLFDIVFKQGDYADKMYIILKGSVSLWVHEETDEEYNTDYNEPEASVNQ
jgi:CRP-like cAMP-binding protein